MKTLSIFLLAFGLAGILPANADLLRYTDAQGSVHYVDNLEKVPAEFRSQLQNAPDLAKISRAGSALYHEPPGPRLESGPRRSDVLDGPAARLGRDKLEIFVTSWCPHCRELEAFLKQHKIRHTRYDIDSDPKARKKHDELGGGGVPLSKLGGKIIRGFNSKTFEKLL